MLKDFHGALQDCTKCIELSSEESSNFDYPDPDIYIIRGFTKKALGDIKGGCEDWKSAEDIGSDKATDLLKQYCINI